MSAAPLREAAPADAEAIAALRAASWRSACRAIPSDAFLAGPVAQGRLALGRAPRRAGPRAPAIGRRRAA